MSVQVTEEDFKEYVKVQESGKYNMITEMNQAMSTTKLSKEQWFAIMKDYDKYYDAWLLDDELEKEDMKNEEKNNED
tara:strand:+ start:822 stop:1052 length:231 start_codon:yes stop_codon:yes gene_type:complete